MKAKKSKELDRPDEAVERVAESGIIAPRAGDCFWRPRYARLWWMGSAIFWLLAFTVPMSALRDALEGWEVLIFVTIMLFHPFVIVPVLGFGFFRAWVAVVQMRPTDELLARGGPSNRHCLSALRHRNPYLINPADPRSALNPLNPLSEIWRAKWSKR